MRMIIANTEAETLDAITEMGTFLPSPVVSERDKFTLAIGLRSDVSKNESSSKLYMNSFRNH